MKKKKKPSKQKALEMLEHNISVLCRHFMESYGDADIEMTFSREEHYSKHRDQYYYEYEMDFKVK